MLSWKRRKSSSKPGKPRLGLEKSSVMSTSIAGVPASESQLSTFNSFKKTLEDMQMLTELHDDVHLLRFLRARQFNIQESLKMFMDCQQWRQQEKVDFIVENFVFDEEKEVMRLYPRYYHKTDKEGRSVYIESLGTMDTDELFKVTSKERLMTHLIREFEKYTRYRLPACAKKSGKPIFQGLVILDLLNAPLSQFNSIRLLIQDLTSISSNYYPETLGKMVIINAPWLFSAIWTVVSGFLDEKTAAKISVLGTGYQSELLELVDAENLPVSIGGTCNCPGGCENADIGPWNDGSVEGYPQEFWESFKSRDLAAGR